MSLDKYTETLDILDDIDDMGHDTYQARQELSLLLTQKERPEFLAMMSKIRYDLLVKYGINPNKFYSENYT